PLVACHKNKQQKAKLRYKEMLASTIQFSKYGQATDPHSPHTSEKHPQGKQPTHQMNPPAVW
ncbi:hypothetical protein, partial [Kribbella pittospori]|uniref:hypothetical protein n=1 Tax=Kribbella pittospori TaxID=722689 RepID=UPI001EDF4622